MNNKKPRQLGWKAKTYSILSLKDAAKVLGIKTQVVISSVNNHELPILKIEGRMYIAFAELADWSNTSLTTNNGVF